MHINIKDVPELRMLSLLDRRHAIDKIGWLILRDIIKELPPESTTPATRAHLERLQKRARQSLSSVGIWVEGAPQ
jgi:hypothetical protein